MSLLSLAFLAVAVWIVAADRLDPSSSTTLLIDDPQWRSWLTAAGAAAAVAAYLGIASLETAAAMRVLSPDHALPARQPSILRIADPGVALAGLPLRSPLEWPATALPAPFGAVQALRCTVLIPAYNEGWSSTRRCARFASRQDLPTGCWSSPTTAPMPRSKSPGASGPTSSRRSATRRRRPARSTSSSAPAAHHRRTRRHPRDGCRLDVSTTSSWRPDCVVSRMTRPSWPSAACSTARPGHGLIGQFQRNEYSRYRGWSPGSGSRVRAHRDRVDVPCRRPAAVAQAGVSSFREPGDVYDTQR